MCFRFCLLLYHLPGNLHLTISLSILDLLLVFQAAGFPFSDLLIEACCTPFQISFKFLFSVIPSLLYLPIFLCIGLSQKVYLDLFFTLFGPFVCVFSTCLLILGEFLAFKYDPLRFAMYFLISFIKFPIFQSIF